MKGMNNVALVVGGMIGLGKTSVSEMLRNFYQAKGKQAKVYYESVDDNPILPLFYELTEQELNAQRIPFLLQLWFLNKRFSVLKDALLHTDPIYTIQDRSLYEDWYFADTNRRLGRITNLEMSIYEGLADNMLQEIDELPKKAPDLMIYLKGSFDTVLNRISKRGRSFELDPDLKDYYYELWKGYDNWLFNHYNASDSIIIDMDKTDIVNNLSDRIKVCGEVDLKLQKILTI
jgi:deoxyadenosine/deoxycytidine kinase